MPVVIEYQSEVALAEATRIEGNSDGVAEAFGEISNATATHPPLDIHVHFEIPVATSATDGGTYEIYMVSSNDGDEWTDGIDPGSSGDVASSLVEAKRVAVLTAHGTASGPSFARFDLNVASFYPNMPPYIGFIHDNNSGQTVPTSTATGSSNYVMINYATG